MSRTTTTRSSSSRSAAGRRGVGAAPRSRALGLDQEERFIGIQTAVADVFGLVSFTYREEVSRLFQLEAELASLDGDVDYDRVIGQPAVVRINTGPRAKRFIHGWVSRLDQLAPGRRYARYRLTLVPWLWFLNRSADCRIYQAMNVPDIVQDVFKRHGFNDFEWRTSGTYAAWEYCVQYRETAFNFVSRLLEQEGIYYYFRHEASKHTLVLCDGPSAHDPIKGYETYPFRPGTAGQQGAEALHDWRIAREVQTSAYEHTDYDFKDSKRNLKTKYSVRRKHGQAGLAQFDYPGEYVVPDEGESWARVRLQEMQARLQVSDGEGTLRGIATGATFELKEYPRRDQNRKHLVLAARHVARAGDFESETDESERQEFRTWVRAVDAAIPYRPARLTPKPVVQGPQTAIVVGPANDPKKEVHVDEHSRIKVHFHWDRHHPKDDSASCWIRVAQPWAGKGFGGLCMPRVGQEVVVEFLEGDPDQPLINGRVYNNETMPPISNAGREDSETRRSRDKAKAKKKHAAEIKQEREARKKGPEPAAAAAVAPSPATSTTPGTPAPPSPPTPPAPVKVSKSKSILDGFQKFLSDPPPNPFNTPPSSIVDATMMSSMRSNSLGGAPGLNEITMNDAGGAEGLFMKAQKDNINTIGNDRETAITNDDLTTVGNDRTETVGNDETIQIGNDRLETVGNDETIQIGNDRNETVGNNEDIEIGNDRTEQVGNDEKITIGNDRTERVGNDESIEIGNDRKEKVGNNETIEIIANRTEKVGGDEKVEIVGNRTEKVGKDETIEVLGSRGEKVHKKESILVGEDRTVEVTGKQTTSVKKDRSLTVKANDSVTVQEGNQTVDVANGAQKTNVKGAIETKSQAKILIQTAGNATITQLPGIVTVTATQNIYIGVAESFIAITPAGIQIVAPKIDLNP